jgi:SAM-dependent methyltransferase
MSQLVEEVLEIRPPEGHAKVLDVGCNDGSMLAMFKARGLETVGVDPTDAIQESIGCIDSKYQRYFDNDTADELLINHGHFDFIVMTNVFAHIDDFQQLCLNLGKLIGPKTLVVIENHYLGSIVKSKQFDTFYHEHPRTYSAHSFEYVAEALGCGIDSISFPNRYGGNIRVIMSKSSIGTKFDFPDESTLGQSLIEMQGIFEKWKLDSAQIMEQLSQKGVLAGKSLPGRAVMLITSLGITQDRMGKIFEKPDSPKVGHYVPGTGIEIVSDNELAQSDSTDLIIWAWHIVDEVLEYVEGMGYRGRVWVPLPEFKMIRDLS